MSSNVERAIVLGIAANTTEAMRELNKVNAAIRAVKDPTGDLQKSFLLLNDMMARGEKTQQQVALAMMHLGRQAEKQIAKNMGLAKSYDSVARAAEAAASAKREGAAYMQQFETRSQAMARRISEANEMHRKGAISADQHAMALKRISFEGSLAGRAFGQLKGVASTLLGPLVATVAAFEGIRRSVQLANEYDVSRARLAAFTGSGEVADNMLGSIRQMTSQMPVSFRSAQKSATTMMQYNVQQKNVVDMTRRIAMITAGQSESMDSMSLAFAQVSGAGRLMGQELLQMINAGFNPLAVIAKNTGESMAEIKKRMEEGGVSFEEVTKAIIQMTDKTGKFGNVMDEMGKTGAGAWTRLRAEVEKTGTSIGRLINSLFGDSIEGFTAILALVNNAGNQSGLSASEQFLNARSQKRNLQKASYFGVGTPGIAAAFGNFGESQDAEVEKLLGGADPSKMSAAAVARFNELKEADKNRAKMTGYDLWVRRQKLTRDLENASPEDAKRAWVSFGEDVGRGSLRNNAERDMVDTYRKEIEALDELSHARKRAKEAFENMSKKASEGRLEMLYGKNRSGIVGTLREQSAGDERIAIDKLIAKGAAYEKIMGAANAAAQAEAKRIEDINDAVEKHNSLKPLESEIKFRKELITLGREQALINQMSRDKEISPELAAEIRAKQRQIELLDSADKPANRGLVPKAMQAESREAFTKIAEIRAGRVAEQIRLQREHLAKAAAQLVATNRTNDILDNIGVV